MLLFMALISACSAVPKSTTLLDQARMDYILIQKDKNIVKYAELELKHAGDALDQANIAAIHNESTDAINKLAYLAKQKIALTVEAAKIKSAEADIASAGIVRKNIILTELSSQLDKAKIKISEEQKRSEFLEAQLAELSTKKTGRGIVITLGSILFDTNKSDLSVAGTKIVQKLADFLHKNQNRTVLIEGFTDKTGNTLYNKALSTRRAASVSRSLHNMGVANSRVTIQGYGEAYPVASNNTRQGRQLNRRVEVILSDEHGFIRSR